MAKPRVSGSQGADSAFLLCENYQDLRMHYRDKHFACVYCENPPYVFDILVDILVEEEELKARQEDDYFICGLCKSADRKWYRIDKALRKNWKR